MTSTETARTAEAQIAEARERKIAYLSTYADLWGAAADAQGVIASVTAISAVCMTGMPHGGGHRDLSDRVIDIISAEERMHERTSAALAVLPYLMAAIGEVESAVERRVLIQRYLTLTKTGRQQTWEEIADRIGYSRRQITRIHDAALDHLIPIEIPEHLIA